MARVPLGVAARRCCPLLAVIVPFRFAVSPTAPGHALQPASRKLPSSKRGPRRLWDILDGLREEWLRHGYPQLHGAQVFILPKAGRSTWPGQLEGCNLPASPPR